MFSQAVINIARYFSHLQKLNLMLITRFVCIQRKSSRFLSPVFTVFARNAWDHGRPFGPIWGRPTNYQELHTLPSVPVNRQKIFHSASHNQCRLQCNEVY